MSNVLVEGCWQCERTAKTGFAHGHFHCDRCGASILDGEDPWYRDEAGEGVLCLKCKLEDTQG
jgi:hypothetical protein